MQTNVLSKTFAVLTLAAVLASCGGGGGGSSGSTSGGSGGSPTTGGGSPTTTHTGNAAVVTEDGKLITFDRTDPTEAQTILDIKGLIRGDSIVGMDVNPHDNKLYALTYKGAVVVLDIITGIATPLQEMQPAPGELFSKLPGGLGDVDFDPLSGLLHIFTQHGDHYLIDLEGYLIYQGDGVVAGMDGSGFSDSFEGGASTALSLIDGAAGLLYLNVDPRTGKHGSPIDLGFNALGEAGFDLSADNQYGFATLLLNDAWQLVHIDTSGEGNSPAHLLGKIPGLHNGDKPTALALLQPLVKVLGLTHDNQLISFLPHDPKKILRKLPIKGLLSGESILGMDMRPGDGSLYCLTSLGRMLKIDHLTGGTELITQLTETFEDGVHSIDWDPVKDVLRIITEHGDNFELGPNGLINILTSLLSLVSDLLGGLLSHNPLVDGSAFSHNFPGAEQLSELLSLDMANGQLLEILPLDILKLGNLGLPGGAESGGFDILGGLNGLPLAAIQPEAGDPFSLYFVDLADGGLSKISDANHSMIGGPDGPAIKDIALIWEKP